MSGAIFSQAWLTPDEIPGSTRCRVLLVPDDDDIFSCVTGALLLLTDPDNWEKYGSVEPVDIASAMSQMFSDCVGKEPPCMYPGMIAPFAMESLPDGWLKCDGGLYDVADYPSLYSAIGNIWGGVPDDTFNVPDAIGRVVLGSGEWSPGFNFVVGGEGGEQQAPLVVAQLPAHSHNSPPHAHLSAFHTLSAAVLAPGAVPILRPIATTQTPTTSEAAVIEDTGSGADVSKMQPYAVICWGIKT